MEASVIIIAHNNVELSRACISALIANTQAAFELILVDDGSSDATFDYFQSVTRKAYRIKHSGVAAARNEGLKHSTGDLTVFIDNDIFVSPLWLSILCWKSVADRVGIIGGIPSNERYKLQFPQSADGLIDVQEVSGAIFGITRPCFQEVGFFDEALVNAGEDTDYCYRAILAGFRVALCPNVVLRHGDGATRKRLDQGVVSGSQRKFYQKWRRYSQFDLVRRFAGH